MIGIYVLRGILFLLVVFVFQVTLSGYSRKVVARIQKRYGPPVYQNFLDIFKLLFKRSAISHGLIFDFGLWMAFGGTLATAIFIPVYKFSVIPDTAYFIVIIYLLAIGLLGMAMSSVGSGNPNASIGISRALTQMLGYEVPFVLIAIMIFYAFQTNNIQSIALMQKDFGINILRYPLGTIVAFISLMGMLGKKPFDSPIAPHEIASGPLVEYSGKNLGMLMIQHEFATFIEISLFINLFLGVNSYIDFILKYIIVWTILVMISAIMPRYKVDQAVKFYWKVGFTLVAVQAALVYLL